MFFFPSFHIAVSISGLTSFYECPCSEVRHEDGLHLNHSTEACIKPFIISHLLYGNTCFLDHFELVFMQRLIFDKPEDGVRKIVLATNMAETSITINDVVFVVDCGKAKETSYDALNNTPCLLPSWISKAAARQVRPL